MAVLELSRHGSPPVIVLGGKCRPVRCDRGKPNVRGHALRQQEQAGVSLSQKVPSPDDGSVNGADNIGVDDNVPADSGVDHLDLPAGFILYQIY